MPTRENRDLITEPDAKGELSLRAGWPRKSLHDEELYRKCFVGGCVSRANRPGGMPTDGSGARRVNDIIKTRWVLRGGECPHGALGRGSIEIAFIGNLPKAEAARSCGGF